MGCIRAFMLNGKIVDLQHMAKEYSYGIHDGCVGKCVSNPCLNNGTCIEGYSSYVCDCQWTGFKGPICADGKNKIFEILIYVYLLIIHKCKYLKQCLLF